MRISDWSSDVCSSDLAAPSVSFFAKTRTGSLRPSTTSLSIITSSTPSNDGRSNMVSSNMPSSIERSPRAPVLRSIARRAIAESASRSEEHTSELQSLMRISYAVFCLKKKKQTNRTQENNNKDKQIKHTK